VACGARQVQQAPRPGGGVGSSGVLVVQSIECAYVVQYANETLAPCSVCLTPATGPNQSVCQWCSGQCVAAADDGDSHCNTQNCCPSECNNHGQCNSEDTCVCKWLWDGSVSPQSHKEVVYISIVE
jgi:hypothetical protein